MKNIHLLTLLFCIVINQRVSAQDEVIPLWANSVPGEIPAKDYTEKEIFKDGEVTSVSQVTIPTLSIYKPQANANGTAIIILPGGGYDHLSMYKEGKKVAEWFTSLGVTAFVLKYRLPNSLIMTEKSIGPLQDAQEAIRIVRRNAAKWNLNPNKIGVIGFSAGGHLAATLSTHFSENTYNNSDSTSARPDYTLLLYPVISMQNDITHKGSKSNLLGNDPSDKMIKKFSNELCVTPETPATFIVHASDDLSVPVENSINYFLALKKNHVSSELHVYEKGGHGFGLGTKDTSQFWTSDCINWLRSNFFFNPLSK